MAVGGLLFDAHDTFHTFQMLPGSVNLERQPDVQRQAANSLWALKKCFPALAESLEDGPGPRLEILLPRAPRVGLDLKNIQFTRVIKRGVVFEARCASAYLQTLGVHEADLQAEFTTCLIKAIFKRPYSSLVHNVLAALGFAPKLFGHLVPNEGSGLVRPSRPRPEFEFFIMQYLFGPSATQPGYITLADLALQADVAALFKERIKKALLYVVDQLSLNRLVHGDLRPNNILVKVEKQPDQTYLPLSRSDLAIIDISIVDFDWAGETGEAFYPKLRNSDIAYWPGKAGEVIGQEHDRLMVNRWMEVWPEPPPTPEA